MTGKVAEATEGLASRLILAPYLPTPPEVVERMLDLAGVTSADVVYDLGCGDGRIVIAAAKRGARAVGFDIEGHWVGESRRNAAEVGVSDLASFELQDALLVDLSPATVVMLYLVEWSTRKLDAKLAAELRPGARIVSHSFSMGASAPVRTERWIDAEGEERTLRLWVAGDCADATSLSGSALPASAVADQPAPRRPDVPADLSDLQLATFAPQVGSRFAVADAESEALGLELVEASALDALTALPRSLRAPFRLLFRGPAAPTRRQGILPLEHAELGRLEIFLVPIGPDAEGRLYEAIFT